MDFDPIRAIAMILIGSFAIDRVVTGLFFLLSYDPDLRKSLDPSSVTDPREQAEAMRNYKLLYAILGGYLGTVVIAGYMNIRLFASTVVPGSEFIGDYPLLDIFLTGLVLLGGADRLAEALKMLGGSGVPASRILRSRSAESWSWSSRRREATTPSRDSFLFSRLARLAGFVRFAGFR